MNKKFYPWLKTLSGFFNNISVVWFTLAFITPNFTNGDLLTLTLDVLLGILFLLAAGLIESVLDYDKQ